MGPHMTFNVHIKLYKNFGVGNCDCDCVQKYEELINIQNVLQKGGFPLQLIDKIQEKQKTRTDNTEDNMS
jgi:hypothetical protein